MVCLPLTSTGVSNRCIFEEEAGQFFQSIEVCQSVIGYKRVIESKDFEFREIS